MTVLDKAQNFSGGPVAAARQRDRWARAEANATDDETRAQFHEAIADLEARYPDLEDVPVGGAEAYARDRGHGSGARSPVHGGRSRPRAPAMQKAGAPSSKRQKGPQSPSKTPGLSPTARRKASSGSRRAKTPRLDRAIRDTGIPAALSGGTSTGMMVLGGTAALALLYLVLDSSETPGSGASAVPTAINETVGFLHRFIGLGDIFPPIRPKAAASSPAPSRSALTPAPRGSAISRSTRSTRRPASLKTPRPN